MIRRVIARWLHSLAKRIEPKPAYQAYGTWTAGYLVGEKRGKDAITLTFNADSFHDMPRSYRK